MDGPEPHIDRRFFVEANPQNLQALRPFIRQRGTEPLPAALEVMGAPVVPQNEFRMLGSRYEVRELPARRIRAHSNLLGIWHSFGPPGEWGGDQLFGFRGKRPAYDATHLYSQISGSPSSSGPNR